MENWFKNEWLYDKSPERGQSLTEMYKNKGYKSLHELRAYNFVDRVISDFGIDMGISPETMVDLNFDFCKSKNEKLELYRMLDLTEVLNRALQMNEDEKLVFHKELGQKFLENKSPEDIVNMIENHEKYIELAYEKEKELRGILEDKKNKKI